MDVQTNIDNVVYLFCSYPNIAKMFLLHYTENHTKKTLKDGYKLPYCNMCFKTIVILSVYE